MQQHSFNIVKRTIQFAGRDLSIETGRIAKQANGSVFISYGETTLLVTATMGKDVSEGQDFFPLTVDVAEKMFAAGKIPGGFFKRETKPSTESTLLARLIDRTIRPLFPEGFRNPVHVVVTPLSFDGVNDPSVLGILGASVALCISDIPFHGPVAGVNVGIINGECVINPTTEQVKESILDLSVGGTSSSVVMIESGSTGISEEQILDAVYFGHEAIKEVCKFQEEFAKEAGKEKIEVLLDVIPEALYKMVDDDFSAMVKEAVVVKGKLERYEAFEQIKVKITEKYSTEMKPEEYEANVRYINQMHEELIRKYVRSSILYDHFRADGRGLDDIRPISCEIDVLPRVHGSALFTRGETQSIGTVTLGSVSDQQVIDGLAEEYKKTFFLHYNFPPYSVGEVGGMRAPGRRELGHGALAERSLKAVIPPQGDFPYTIRIVSDITESNGSSSMASVCSGSLALMAAGVPIKAPVAGIANGLIMEGNDFVVLTDIQGLEDHLGDMDFKVAGTKEGITAMQMDIKIEGITKEIMSIALTKAKAARNTLIGYIEETISTPKEQVNEYAPRIETFSVDTSKIGEIIGPAGKNIKAIIDETKVDINIDDSGTVTIASSNKPMIELAKERILGIVTPLELNKIYEGVVTRIESYGIFVKVMSNKEGMIHISLIPDMKGKVLADNFKIGDKATVKYIGADKGKIALSMKLDEDAPERPRNDDRRGHDRRGYGDRDRRDYGDRERGGDRDRGGDRRENNHRKFNNER